MRDYQLYMRHLNRRMLAIAIILFVFWIEHLYWPFIPQTSGVLNYVVGRISEFLALMAWPYFLIMFVQLMLNRFFFYGLDGEVRAATFSYEIRGFFQRAYLYSAFLFAAIIVLRTANAISEVGFEAWQAQLTNPLFVHITVLVVRAFTLGLSQSDATLLSTFLFGLGFVALYFALSVMVHLPLGDRDKRAAPGQENSKFEEPHNSWIRSCKENQRWWLIIGLVFATLFAFWTFLALDKFAIFIIIVASSALVVIFKHVFSYIHYGWNKVFNVHDLEPVERTSYYSAADWLESDAYNREWKHRKPSSLFRFSFRKENLWPLPLRLAYVIAIELVFIFIILAVLGILSFGTNSPFYERVTELNLSAMAQAVWASSGLIIKILLALYGAWRLFIRLRQFSFQLKYSALNFDIDRFGSLPKFIFILVTELLLFALVLAIAGTLMFDFHKAYLNMVFSFDLLNMLKAVYEGSGFMWKAILGGYLGWRALVRIGNFRLGLFDLLGNFIPSDD
ncbi:hypothetical protein [Aliidiomarina celeris]|uniref:hypothetical protein n=1 Tax=Aliidiomarina celeris TaxID=2249428 RepID=UPI0013003280|nr:hypothetical protein [Aliidiomarina celeris]